MATKKRYDANLINAFVEAARYVIETVAFKKASVGKPYLKKDRIAMGDVSGVIELTEDIKGTISISFKKNIILPIVSSMLGEEMNELDDDIKDAVSEITNMIAGQATQKLANFDKSLKAAFFKSIMEENHTIPHIESQPVIAIPLTIDKGEFTIEVCFEK